jgi:hypothetical protein
LEIAKEEIFSPAAPIITTNHEKETIKIANDSKFGLGTFQLCILHLPELVQILGLDLNSLLVDLKNQT